jgi:cellulose synthase/poly-beta-1,6-N-acetylglucosamine synthase-like glycosyltransferase
MLISFPQILLEFAAFGLILATTAFAAQTVAALLLPDRPLPVASLRPSIAVLIPAHDEEQTIEATLIRIKEELSPADRLLVVADTCVDRTTTLATRAGADVVIRNDPNLRGKGFALAAGLRHLAATPPDVVVFIDADCRVGSGGVGLLARACAASNAPVQCLNLMIADPDSRASPPRLAEFAWRIKNDLRPNGYARLGLPCQLLGTGMALPWRLIDPEMFATGHLTEDLLVGLSLAMKGFSPRFFREASVTSYFPESQRSQDRQKQRWMHGHFALIYSHTPRLIHQALRRRDFGLLALAADLAVPPLGVLAVANMALLLMSLAWMAAVGARAPLVFATLTSALFASSLVAAWCVCGRDLIGLEEVKLLPRHIITVLGSALNAARGHKVPWFRTDRV